MNGVVSVHNVQHENTGAPKSEKIHANLVRALKYLHRVNDSSFKCYFISAFFLLFFFLMQLSFERNLRSSNNQVEMRYRYLLLFFFFLFCFSFLCSFLCGKKNSSEFKLAQSDTLQENNLQSREKPFSRLTAFSQKS